MLKMINNKNLMQNLNEHNPISLLKLSTDASIQHIRNISAKAIDLFCLLGLMPGGISDTDLDILWRAKEDNKYWDGKMEILK